MNTKMIERILYLSFLIYKFKSLQNRELFDLFIGFYQLVNLICEFSFHLTLQKTLFKPPLGGTLNALQYFRSFSLESTLYDTSFIIGE
jgi:hypothetical protein